ncbi:MAG: histidine kinase [bacterium]|nr:histidine kinase [bacterium]
MWKRTFGRLTKKMSLSGKILGLFGTLNLLIVAGVVFSLYAYFQGIIRDYVTQGILSVEESNRRETENFLKRMETSVNLINENDMLYADERDISEIARMILTADPAVTEIGEIVGSYNQNVKTVNEYFQTCFGDGGRYLNILYIDTEWPIHRFAQERGIVNGWSGLSSSKRMKEEAWYQKAEELDGECCWFFEESAGYLCMAKLMKLQYMGAGMEIRREKLGVLLVCFEPSVLAECLNVNGLTEHSRISVYTEENELLHSLSASPEPQEEFEDGEALSLEKPLPLGLRMVTEIPVRDVRRMTSGAVRIIIFGGFFILCTILFLGVVLAHTVILPLKRFTRCMEKGALEEFPIDQDREDEIGILFQAYNRMMLSLEDSVRKEKQAELHALQAQINPHFFYNTLNSVSSLALLNGQKQIADLIGWLTKIMRYRISYDTRLVTVAEEVETIRQYEHIQEYCYGGSVVFCHEIDGEAEHALIPKLMLQPLVENALLHGCNPEENVIEVLLQAKAEEGSVRIMVQDNGTEADIGTINRYLDGTRKYKSDSIGIRNIYRRIRLEFGEAADFRYEKTKEGYTAAVITIPLKTEPQSPGEEGGRVREEQDKEFGEEEEAGDGDEDRDGENGAKEDEGDRGEKAGADRQEGEEAEDAEDAAGVRKKGV